MAQGGKGLPKTGKGQELLTWVQDSRKTGQAQDREAGKRPFYPVPQQGRAAGLAPCCGPEGPEEIMGRAKGWRQASLCAKPVSTGGLWELRWPHASLSGLGPRLSFSAYVLQDLDIGPALWA